jgi:hypothetical protein
MGQIILKIDELVAQKWATLSLEQKERLTWQFEELVLQLFSNAGKSDSMKKTINEPSTTYKATEKKEKKENVKQVQTMRKAERPTYKSKNRTERRQQIETLTSPLLVDLSKFKFDRNEANDYGS